MYVRSLSNGAGGEDRLSCSKLVAIVCARRRGLGFNTILRTGTRFRAPKGLYVLSPGFQPRGNDPNRAAP
jgi:hypothetical protein